MLGVRNPSVYKQSANFPFSINAHAIVSIFAQGTDAANYFTIKDGEGGTLKLQMALGQSRVRDIDFPLPIEIPSGVAYFERSGTIAQIAVEYIPAAAGITFAGTFGIRRDPP